VFRKVRAIDMTLAQFEQTLVASARVIQTTHIDERVKELLLLVDWVRPLHAVVVVDDTAAEERVVTVYEPTQNKWTDDYQRRR
jgi:hypothetical protein